MPEPRVNTEIDLLVDYIGEQLTALRSAAYGLTEKQGRAAPCVSALSIGGLLKHTQWVMTQAQRRRGVRGHGGTASPGEFHGYAGDLLHMVEEFARHAGHADLIREQLDGATAIELAYGIEGREGNDWVTPWTPPDDKV